MHAPALTFLSATLHMGKINRKHVYSMASCNIEQNVEERDLGILVIKFDHTSSYMVIGKARRLLVNLSLI